jgi:hypothetical protein
MVLSRRRPHGPVSVGASVAGWVYPSLGPFQPTTGKALWLVASQNSRQTATAFRSPTRTATAGSARPCCGPVQRAYAGVMDQRDHEQTDQDEAPITERRPPDPHDLMQCRRDIADNEVPK